MRRVESGVTRWQRTKAKDGVQGTYFVCPVQRVQRFSSQSANPKQIPKQMGPASYITYIPRGTRLAVWVN